MSAQLSSTASNSLSSDKNANKSPTFLRDLDCDFAKPAQSADQSNGREAVSPGGDRSNDSSLNSVTHLQPSLRLLVVDESSQVRQICCEAGESYGFIGIEAETISSARKILERKDTAILMLDLQQTESEGQSLLAEMRSLCPNTLVIGMSASATIASAVEAMRAGVCDYLSKPFALHVLTRALDRATKRLCFDVERRKIQSAANSWSGMGDSLGQSVEMEKLYGMLSRVANSRYPVMIVGESGTGKELVARSIHSNGPDSSKPFVAVDCKSMATNVLEDVLFGGLKSASGRAGMHGRGLLVAPEGGTVFLDEIGNLSLGIQGRLVKGLREKRVCQLEGIQAHTLSVRILGATSHNLTQMVGDGRFRLDLYVLLSLVNLTIPPLRGRPDDIAFLAKQFLEKIGQRTGVPRSLSRETFRMLETYDWPDNTRELEIAITQACTLSSGAMLEVDHLPQNILTFHRTKEAERNCNFSSIGKPRIQLIEEDVIPIATMEKRAILKALKQTDGDRVMAAGLLGIGKTTLYRKLKEYSVPVKPESGVSLPTSSPDSTSSPNVPDSPSHLICA
jgi:DNA-binding NtrC family response regulator